MRGGIRQVWRSHICRNTTQRSGKNQSFKKAYPFSIAAKKNKQKTLDVQEACPVLKSK
jgi:hypothetical protein